MSVEVAQVVVPVVPDRAEILQRNLRCPEPGCESVFKCQSNLTLHRIKVHKKNDVSLASRPRENTQICFYCPEEDCIYNHHLNMDENKNYFSEFKQLKQHFVKVHKERNFECKNCSKAFPDEFSLRRHEKSCGFKLFCAICGSSYRNQPSLTYHIKTKGHLFEWGDFQGLWEAFGPEDEPEKRKKSRKKNQAIQTETRAKKRGVSQASQTTVKRRKTAPSTATETQTQTLPFDPSLVDDALFRYTDNSSQTTLPSSSHIETQTERDVFLSQAQDSDSSTDLLLFTHSHTQTTNEELLAEFSDIQTQTHWDFDLCSDFLVSAETQTPRILQGLESTSIQTQTMQFGYDSSHTQT